MRTTKQTFLCAICFTLLVFGAFSCKVAEEDGYGRWDADSNALIDTNEFGTAWREAGYYDRWDANSDDVLDESEWNAGRNSYMQNYNESEFGAYGDWDADADGRLNEDEFRDGVFEVYDVDSDGNLADVEYNSWWNTFNSGI